MSNEVVVNVPMAGVVHNLPNEVYHSIAEAISNTGLGDFAQSPAHFYGRHLDPKRPPRKTLPGQLAGTLAHCALLEPHEFDKRYVVGPAVHKSTNVWKAFKAECEAAGKTPIDQEDRDVAFLQAEQALLLPSVAKGMAAGHSEVSVFWIDEETGVRCRCRPDWWHPVGTETEPGVILFDAKTFTDASPREFARQVKRKAYHRQAAFYTDGVEAATGMPVHAFVFICLETEWPHKAAALMLRPEDLELGRTEYRALLNSYAECVKTNTWPGYSPDIEILTLPRY